MPPQPDRGPWSTWSNILALDPPSPLRNLFANAHHRLTQPYQPRLAILGEHRNPSPGWRGPYLKVCSLTERTMHQPFADLELKRDDLKRLYPREPSQEWVIKDGGFDWYDDLRVRRDGIYLRDPDEGMDPAGLSDAERAALPQHPTDGYSKPLLKLPCTLGEFEAFIDRYNLLAPDGFRLLEVVGEQGAPVAQTDVGKQADDGLAPRRRNSYLRVIAALMVRGKVESTSKPYEVADDLNVKLDLLGVSTLKPDTIASVIKEVRNYIDLQKK